MINATMRLRGGPLVTAPVDPAANALFNAGRAIPANSVQWDVPTAGSVYGVLLNFRGALAALGGALHQDPYKAPPKAPVLYIKTANTLIGCGAAIPLPDNVDAVEIGGALGIVIGRTASRVTPGEALSFVAGYTVVNDVSVPHQSFYRQPIRHKCRDGFCPIGPWTVARGDVPNPDVLTLRVYVNGELRQENSTANLVRPVAQLIADVSEFMTLAAGDVLLAGVPEGAPLARAGDRVAVEVERIGRLENPIVAKALLFEEGRR